jgi:hypothetical protein
MINRCLMGSSMYYTFSQDEEVALLSSACMHLLDKAEVDVDALKVLRAAQITIINENKIRRVEERLDGIPTGGLIYTMPSYASYSSSCTITIPNNTTLNNSLTITVPNGVNSCAKI